MNDQARRLRQLYQTRAGRYRYTGRNHRSIARSVAVTSGKGGVGKTNICLNVGIALARQKKRVLLMDADLNLGSLDVLLGLNPEHTIRNVLADEIPLADIRITGPAGIHLLPATSGAAELANISSGQRQMLLDALTALIPEYDYLLIDTPAGIGTDVMEFIDWVDDVMMVTTPEPSAIIDAYAMIKLIWYRNANKLIHLVVNFSESKTDAEEVVQKLSLVTEQYLQQSVVNWGYVLYDEMLSKSVFDQQAVVELHPKTPASICLENLVDLLKQPRRTIDNVHAGKERIAAGL